jgi:hypothetical protein
VRNVTWRPCSVLLARLSGHPSRQQQPSAPPQERPSTLPINDPPNLHRLPLATARRSDALVNLLSCHRQG